MRVQTGEILREQPFIELDVSSCAPVSRNIGTLPDPDCSSCVQASSYMWSSIMGSSCTIASSTPIWCVPPQSATAMHERTLPIPAFHSCLPPNRHAVALSFAGTPTMMAPL